MGKGKSSNRLDLLLVERGLTESRAKAQAVIMAGLVTVDGVKVEKAGAAVPLAAVVELKGPDHPYVSRGGVKLAGALDHFGVDPTGLVCLDVGASTGGFTDCLLQRGARLVYALDVGTNQLHYKLRCDPRVKVFEQTHIKDIGGLNLEPPPSIVVVDVSFISLKLVLPHLFPFLHGGAALLAMVKPQFEAGRELVGKGGVIQDEEVRAAVCAQIAAFLIEHGFSPEATFPASITGPKGNQEYFVYVPGRPETAAGPADPTPNEVES